MNFVLYFAVTVVHNEMFISNGRNILW